MHRQQLKETRMKSLALAAAATLFLSSPVLALDSSSMTDAERQAFRDEVRAYLLDNPEVLMEAISVLEQRQAANQDSTDATLIQANAEALFNDGYSYVGGNPDGDLTIVEFMDYKCGYCKKAYPDVNELIKTDGNIRFVVKEFPILGDQSVLAARFAIAAKQLAGDAAYEAVHDQLMTLRGDVTEVSLRQIAKANRLDAEAILAAMNSDTVSNIIAQNHALAGRMQINGTPGFIFQTQMVRGYIPLDGMVQLVAQVRGE